MGYSTIADVQVAAGGAKALLQLSDVDNTNAINVAAVESAIDEADGIIDSRLAGRYAVPLEPPVPSRIRALSAATAAFILKSRRHNMVTEVDLQLHSDRLDELRATGEGEIAIGRHPEPLKSELLRYEATDRPSDKSISRNATKGFW